MRHIKTMLGLGDGLVLVSPCHTHLWSGSSPHWGRRIELTPQHWPLTSIWLPWHMHVPTCNMDTHDKENSLVANYFRGIISLINVTDVFSLFKQSNTHLYLLELARCWQLHKTTWNGWLTLWMRAYKDTYSETLPNTPPSHFVFKLNNWTRIF